MPLNLLPSIDNSAEYTPVLANVANTQNHTQNRGIFGVTGSFAHVYIHVNFEITVIGVGEVTITLPLVRKVSAGDEIIGRYLEFVDTGDPITIDKNASADRLNFSVDAAGAGFVDLTVVIAYDLP